MIQHQTLPSATFNGQSYGLPSSYRFTDQHRVDPRMQGEYRKKIQNYSYLLTDKIGKGYSSTVYKGLDDLTRQQVAIKVIDLKSLRDATSKIMLRTQIQCFREVQHQNVLKFYTSLETANNCYIITEFCPGGDFSNMLKQKGKIPESEALVFFTQIFEGYKAFCEAGYVHRDLKPANILVGKDGQLKLADFGFSKKKTLVDRENYNVGTPIYMPRESLAANIYNEKTDTWALGITLYEMVYGSVPFRGRTEQELRVNIERGNIYFPESVPASQDLKDFIKMSLLNDSMKRMGVKQMQRHPWLAKTMLLQKKCNKDSPQKVSQENYLRTSLPHDLVNHNRSRQYFYQNKQNKRSSSTMQKLKLCMPKKGSQVIKPRQALIDCTSDEVNRKYSESLENKQNKYNNYSTNSTRQDIKTNRNAVKNQGNGIEKLVSLINYFRLLHRILQKTKSLQKQVTNPTFRLSLQHAEKALTDRISQIIKKHLTSLSDKSNQFSINALQWIQFATSQRWRMYEFVIKRYQTKYNPIIEQADKCAGEWQNAAKLYGQLGRFLHNGCLDKVLLRQRYACIQFFGLLNHLCSLDKVIERQGWDDFALKFTNEAILFDSFTVNMENYMQLQTELTQVYLNIKGQNL